MSAAHDRIDRLLEELRTRTPDRVLPALHRLAELETFSDPQYNAFQELLPRTLEVVYESGPLEAFLGLAGNPHFFSSDLYDVLDAHAAELTAEQLIESANALGLPRPGDGNGGRIHSAIARHPDPRISQWLCEWIRTAARSNDQPDGYSRHCKAMSGFRYIRWMPDDGDLADAVGLLVKRHDRGVHEFLKDLLLDLPWPGDHFATLRLLEYFDERGDDESESLLRECLRRYREPSTFRIYLLATYGELQPAHALALAFRDRAGALPGEVADDYLVWIGRVLDELPERGVRLDGPRIESLLHEGGVARWPSLDRAYLGEALARVLPGFDPSSFCSGLDRARLRLVRAFEACRVEHMGWVVVLPGAFLLACLLKKGLDVIATISGPGAESLEYGLIAIWILALAITSHTHFSGRETLKERYRLALAFWGATLAVPIGLTALRIHALLP